MPVSTKEIEFVLNHLPPCLPPNTPLNQKVSLVKCSGGELSSRDPTKEQHEGAMGSIMFRENVAELALWPDYTFNYPRAKYFSSAEYREIWNLKPIFCNSISQELSKEKVTLPG